MRKLTENRPEKISQWIGWRILAPLTTRTVWDPSLLTTPAPTTNRFQGSQFSSAFSSARCASSTAGAVSIVGTAHYSLNRAGPMPAPLPISGCRTLLGMHASAKPEDSHPVGRDVCRGQRDRQSQPARLRERSGLCQARNRRIEHARSIGVEVVLHVGDYESEK